jgi:hypothetical protein
MKMGRWSTLTRNAIEVLQVRKPVHGTQKQKQWDDKTELNGLQAFPDDIE